MISQNNHSNKLYLSLCFVAIASLYFYLARFIIAEKRRFCGESDEVET